MHATAMPATNVVLIVVLLAPLKRFTDPRLERPQVRRPSALPHRRDELFRPRAPARDGSDCLSEGDVERVHTLTARMYTAPASGVGTDGTNTVNRPSSSSSMMNAGTSASSRSTSAGFHAVSSLSRPIAASDCAAARTPEAARKTSSRAFRDARPARVRTAAPTKKHAPAPAPARRTARPGASRGSTRRLAVPGRRLTSCPSAAATPPGRPEPR